MSHSLNIKNGLIVEGDLSATGSLYGSSSFASYTRDARYYQTIYSYLKAQQELTRSVYDICDGFIDDYVDFSGSLNGSETGSFRRYNTSSIYNNPTQSQLITGWNKSTTLLLHFEGTHGDTTTTDSGPAMLPISSSALPFLISETNKKYGNTSLYISGSDRALKQGNHTAFDISASVDFTIEFNMNCSSNTTFRTLFSYNDDTPDPSYGVIAYVDSQHKLAVEFREISFGPFLGPTIDDGNWHHIALVRSGSAAGNVRAYIDGALIFSNSYNGYVTASNQGFKIGSSRKGDTVDPYTGYIDEFRWIIGWPVYSQSFVTSSTAFPDNYLANGIPVPQSDQLVITTASLSGSLFSSLKQLSYVPSRAHCVIIAELLSGSFKDSSSGSFTGFTPLVTRLSGSSYTSMSFRNLATQSNNIFVYGATTDLTTLPIGTQLEYQFKLETGSLQIRLLGVGLLAEE